MSVCILVPSRDRPRQLAELLRSSIQTAPDVTVLAYIDEDQRRLYQWTQEPGVPDQLKVTFGPRVGPVASINHLAMKHRYDFDVFGFMLDDCRLGTLGWDAFLGEIVTSSKNIWLVAPAKNTGDHGDMMFVPKAWLEALGWFAWPGCYHWGWDAIMASLGHATGTYVRATPGQFWVTHDVEPSTNRDKYAADVIQLYDFFSNHFEETLAKLKAAM